MKKTIAVIGSAAALSFAGAGLASAQSAVPGVDAGSLGAGETVETPAEVSEIAAQLCGTIDAYDFLGSAEGVVPGLSGEDCRANADAAIAAAFSGDIQGAIDILQGIDAEVPDEDDGDDAGTEEPGDQDAIPGDDDDLAPGAVE